METVKVRSRIEERINHYPTVPTISRENQFVSDLFRDDETKNVYTINRDDVKSQMYDLFHGGDDSESLGKAHDLNGFNETDLILEKWNEDVKDSFI